MKVKKAVILAAGFGTRMLPASKSVPKEMINLVDRPVMHYLIEEAAKSGVEDILVITSRNKSVMEDYFDYAPELEAQLERGGKVEALAKTRAGAELANVLFVRQREMLGTGHAVSRAKGFVGSDPFAVFLGDDVMHAEKPVIGQLIEASEKFGAPSVGTQLVPPEMVSKYSSLKVEPLEGRVMRLFDMNEKPSPEEKFSDYAILGRYVLTAEIFEILENTKPGVGGEIWLTDALRTLCLRAPMLAVDFEGKRYDTGNLAGYLEATLELAMENAEAGAWLRDFLLKKAAELK